MSADFLSPSDIISGETYKCRNGKRATVLATGMRGFISVVGVIHEDANDKIYGWSKHGTRLPKKSIRKGGDFEESQHDLVERISKGKDGITDNEIRARQLERDLATSIAMAVIETTCEITAGIPGSLFGSQKPSTRMGFVFDLSKTHRSVFARDLNRAVEYLEITGHIQRSEVDGSKVWFKKPFDRTEDFFDDGMEDPVTSRHSLGPYFEAIFKKMEGAND